MVGLGILDRCWGILHLLILLSGTIWATWWENLFMLYANNKCADQRSLISAFVVCCLDSVIPLVSISEISSLCLASVAAQAGSSLPWSQTPKTGFLVTRHIWACWSWNQCGKCIFSPFWSAYLFLIYHNDPKFLDRQVWANSADPDRTAPLTAPRGAVWSGSSLFAIPSASFGHIKATLLKV